MIIGEILWDVFPDSERLGGASFNFAVNSHRLGQDVVFVSAVGDDERGRAALSRAASLGLSLDFIQLTPHAPTGSVSVGLDEGGQPDFTLHRPAAYDCVILGEPELARLAAWNPDWIYYGTLHQIEPASFAATTQLTDALRSARKFYDVNLRRDSYTSDLVLHLLRQADAVKLNEDEVTAVENMAGSSSASLQEFTKDWSRRMDWRAVAVTRGKDGCAVRIADDFAEASGHPITVVDTVGAGDAFAAAFLYGLTQNWGAMRTADFANRLGAVVASRAGGLPEWSAETLTKLP